MALNSSTPTVVSDDTLQTRLRRSILLLSAIGTLAGVAAFTAVCFANGRLNWLEVLAVASFTVLFGWIVFSFLLAALGWWRCLRSPQPTIPVTADPAATPLPERPAAVLMPIYNESPIRVMAGVEAMIASLRKIDRLEGFEFYVLSDTTKYAVWLAEEKSWSALCRRNPDAVVHYRHRAKNTARKAGNIADFCRRWGAHHDYMIVLDADSLVEGETMTQMVLRMESDSAIGILQVPPRPIGRTSLFARLQQFSAAVYGRIFIEGFAVWSGRQGNYWGHNAIIRIAPFCKHCELPLLRGDGPLGGEILSHDFVEAALMVRSGWKVVLAGDLGGSFEECPTTIMDYAIRDHRWCQGNLQHAKLLVAEGFNPLSRSHFASGVMSYVASPIWMFFTACCIGGLIWDRFVSQTPLSIDTPAPPVDGVPGGRIALALFAVSMTLLLLPKAMAVMVHRRDQTILNRRRLIPSALLEVIASIALSPIMAIYHTQFVLSTLLGVTVRWNAQQRSERGVCWSQAIANHWMTTVLGIVATIGLWRLSPGLTAWFSPLLIGLWLSIPLAVLMGSPRVGRWLMNHDLLRIDEEIEKPAIASDCDRFESEQLASIKPGVDLFAEVIDDPTFFALHRGIQQATQSDIPLDKNQTKAIEAALSAGGPARIPDEVRRALLTDSDTLMALHLESQS